MPDFVKSKKDSKTFIVSHKCFINDAIKLCLSVWLGELYMKLPMVISQDEYALKWSKAKHSGPEETTKI